MRLLGKKIIFSILAALLLFCVDLPKSQAGPVIEIGDEAFLAIDYQMQLYGVWRDTGSGPEKKSDTTDIFFRRNRLNFDGQVTDFLGFAVKFEYAGPRTIYDIRVADEPDEELYIFEAYVSGNFSDAFKIRAGRTKIPFAREVLEGCFEPLSIDRSVFIHTPFQRVRDIGGVLWGNFVKNKFQYRVAVMEGRESGESPQSSLRYTGRFHISLMDPEDTYEYKGTYLGDKKVLTIGGGYQFEANVAYGNVSAKTLSKDYKAWTIDGFLEYPLPSGTYTISGAYLKTDFENAYKGGDPDNGSIGLDGQKNGWYVKLGYLPPIELGTLKIGKSKIGPGKIQIFGRYEDWNFAELNGIYDQGIRLWAGGLNYLLNGQDLRITIEYSKTDYKKELRDLNTVTAMLQFRF